MSDLYDAIRKATEIALRKHWELIRRFEFFGTNQGKHVTPEEWVKLGYDLKDYKEQSDE